MCRNKSKGTGRRCPSHTEPDLIEQRNEVRREQYALKTSRDKLAGILEQAGISFQRGDEVKNEYFQGAEAYDPDKFQDVKDPFNILLDDEAAAWMNGRFYQSKPADGGLWTAPGSLDSDGGVKTAWTDWSHEESYSVKDTPISPLVVKKHAVVIQINSEQDLEALCKTFPRPGGGFSYESLASVGVDGVRLTQSGLRVAKGAGPDDALHNFSNWDIDSTVWLSKDSISTTKPVKKGMYEEKEHDEDDDSRWDNYESEDTEGDGNSWSFLDELVARANIAEAEEARAKEATP